MTQADFRAHHGDDFIPGFHGTRERNFGSTIQGSSGYVFFDFFEEFQARSRRKLIFANFRMNNHLRISIRRHRVGRSTEGLQSSQFLDLVFSNSLAFRRMSNSICRQLVV